MNLWIDAKGILVWDNQQYVDAKGNLWTEASDKSQIPGLTQVMQVPQPTTPNTIVTGFTVQLINGIQTQVWNTISMTADQIATAQLNTAQSQMETAQEALTPYLLAMAITGDQPSLASIQSILQTVMPVAAQLATAQAAVNAASMSSTSAGMNS